MLDSGMPLSNVQHLLGHSALSSTRIYYGYSNNAGA
jgi:site-specific recombinase XerD